MCAFFYSLQVYCLQCLLYVDFFYDTVPPPCLIWHLSTLYRMLWAFSAAVYEYTCSFTPLAWNSISLPLVSLSSACILTTPILAEKKTSSFFWSHTSSHTSQHGTKDAQTQTCAHRSNTVYSKEGACWHKFEPTGVILGGMTQVSFRSTSLFIDTSPSLLPDQICW